MSERDLSDTYAKRRAAGSDAYPDRRLAIAVHGRPKATDPRSKNWTGGASVELDAIDPETPSSTSIAENSKRCSSLSALSVSSWPCSPMRRAKRSPDGMPDQRPAVSEVSEVSDPPSAAYSPLHLFSVSIKACDRARAKRTRRKGMENH